MQNRTKIYFSKKSKEFKKKYYLLSLLSESNCKEEEFNSYVTTFFKNYKILKEEYLLDHFENKKKVINNYLNLILKKHKIDEQVENSLKLNESLKEILEHCNKDKKLLLPEVKKYLIIESNENPGDESKNDSEDIEEEDNLLDELGDDFFSALFDDDDDEKTQVEDLPETELEEEELEEEEIEEEEIEEEELEEEELEEEEFEISELDLFDDNTERESKEKKDKDLFDFLDIKNNEDKRKYLDYHLNLLALDDDQKSVSYKKWESHYRRFWNNDLDESYKLVFDNSEDNYVAHQMHLKGFLSAKDVDDIFDIIEKEGIFSIKGDYDDKGNYIPLSKVTKFLEEYPEKFNRFEKLEEELNQLEYEGFLDEAREEWEDLEKEVKKLYNNDFQNYFNQFYLDSSTTLTSVSYIDVNEESISTFIESKLKGSKSKRDYLKRFDEAALCIALRKDQKLDDGEEGKTYTELFDQDILEELNKIEEKTKRNPEYYKRYNADKKYRKIKALIKARFIKNKETDKITKDALSSIKTPRGKLVFSILNLINYFTNIQVKLGDLTKQLDPEAIAATTKEVYLNRQIEKNPDADLDALSKAYDNELEKEKKIKHNKPDSDAMLGQLLSKTKDSNLKYVLYLMTKGAYSRYRNTLTLEDNRNVKRAINKIITRLFPNKTIINFDDIRFNIFDTKKEDCLYTLLLDSAGKANSNNKQDTINRRSASLNFLELCKKFGVQIEDIEQLYDIESIAKKINYRKIYSLNINNDYINRSDYINSGEEKIKILLKNYKINETKIREKFPDLSSEAIKIFESIKNIIEGKDKKILDIFARSQSKVFDIMKSYEDTISKLTDDEIFINSKINFSNLSNESLGRLRKWVIDNSYKRVIHKIAENEQYVYIIKEKERKTYSEDKRFNGKVIVSLKNPTEENVSINESDLFEVNIMNLLELDRSEKFKDFLKLSEEKELFYSEEDKKNINNIQKLIEEANIELPYISFKELIEEQLVKSTNLTIEEKYDLFNKIIKLEGSPLRFESYSIEKLREFNKARIDYISNESSDQDFYKAYLEKQTKTFASINFLSSDQDYENILYEIVEKIKRDKQKLELDTESLMSAALSSEELPDKGLEYTSEIEEEIAEIENSLLDEEDDIYQDRTGESEYVSALKSIANGEDVEKYRKFIEDRNKLFSESETASTEEDIVILNADLAINSLPKHKLNQAFVQAAKGGIDSVENPLIKFMLKTQYTLSDLSGLVDLDTIVDENKSADWQDIASKTGVHYSNLRDSMTKKWFYAWFFKDPEKTKVIRQAVYNKFIEIFLYGDLGTAEFDYQNIVKDREAMQKLVEEQENIEKNREFLIKIREEVSEKYFSEYEKKLYSTDEYGKKFDYHYSNELKENAKKDVFSWLYRSLNSKVKYKNKEVTLIDYDRKFMERIYSFDPEPRILHADGKKEYVNIQDLSDIEGNVDFLKRHYWYSAVHYYLGRASAFRFFYSYITYDFYKNNIFTFLENMIVKYLCEYFTENYPNLKIGLDKSGNKIDKPKGVDNVGKKYGKPIISSLMNWIMRRSGSNPPLTVGRRKARGFEQKVIDKLYDLDNEKTKEEIENEYSTEIKKRKKLPISHINTSYQSSVWKEERINLGIKNLQGSESRRTGIEGANFNRLSDIENGRLEEIYFSDDDLSNIFDDLSDEKKIFEKLWIENVVIDDKHVDLFLKFIATYQKDTLIKKLQKALLYSNRYIDFHNKKLSPVINPETGEVLEWNLEETDFLTAEEFERDEENDLVFNSEGGINKVKNKRRGSYLLDDSVLLTKLEELYLDDLDTVGMNEEERAEFEKTLKNLYQGTLGIDIGFGFNETYNSTTEIKSINKILRRLKKEEIANWLKSVLETPKKEVIYKGVPVTLLSISEDSNFVNIKIKYTKTSKYNKLIEELENFINENKENIVTNELLTSLEEYFSEDREDEKYFYLKHNFINSENKASFIDKILFLIKEKENLGTKVRKEESFHNFKVSIYEVFPKKNYNSLLSFWEMQTKDKILDREEERTRRSRYDSIQRGAKEIDLQEINQNMKWVLGLDIEYVFYKGVLHKIISRDIDKKEFNLLSIEDYIDKEKESIVKINFNDTGLEKLNQKQSNYTFIIEKNAFYFSVSIDQGEGNIINPKLLIIEADNHYAGHKEIKKKLFSKEIFYEEENPDNILLDISNLNIYIHQEEDGEIEFVDLEDLIEGYNEGEYRDLYDRYNFLKDRFFKDNKIKLEDLHDIKASENETEYEQAAIEFFLTN